MLIPRLFRPTFLALLLLGARAGHAADAGSYELAGPTVQVNALSTGDWFKPADTATPGQFSGALVPTRFLYQRFAAEGSGVALDPKQRRFQEVTGLFTWLQASQDAIRRGGHLAVITSLAEHDEMIQALGTAPAQATARWLGARDAGVEGTWEWVTGEAFSYQRWNAGEPNNFGNEDHLQLLWGGATGNVWNDAPGAVALGGYILEIENDPAVVRSTTSGATEYFVESMIVGLPYLGKASEFLFGSIVPPPATDETGLLLVERPVPLQPGDYWEAVPANEPETRDAQSANYGRFYYSASRREVFATSAGAVVVHWIKRTPEPLANVPVAERTDPTKWVDRGGVFYRVYPQTYLVSASPVQRPRRIYHTEGPNAEGVPVYVPPARVAELKVVYNREVPEEVPIGQGTSAFAEGGLGSSDPNSPQAQAEIRWTLNYSTVQNVLRAANRQGRVFIELVGPQDPATGVGAHLGFEIVDVQVRPIPVGSQGELGDPLAPPVIPGAVDERLVPRVANIPDGNQFVYQHRPTSDELAVTFYAIRETVNPNDLAVWWMTQGAQGILWPDQLRRYELDWPADPARYSHYLRPAVSTEEEARATAVSMPRGNSPRIEYQDDEGLPRAKFTDDFRFYTFLTESFPAHRSLLSFQSGNVVAFERVFSWRQPNLESNLWAGSVAETLSSWRDGPPGPNGEATKVMVWTDVPRMPQLLTGDVPVGTRIDPPDPSPDGAPDYLAGYIQVDPTRRNDLYDRFAYLDPFVVGFTEAARGAIIPVNSIEGRDDLKVFWFRVNAFPPNQGFEAIYWPSVIGTYDVIWPHEDPNWVSGKDNTIVLASNDGSGPLSSLEAKGSIYVQNDASIAGYNPNEEHALMIGGQAYALRDDLNVLTTQGYSSEPYVLLSFRDGTDRPSMRAYRVVREDDVDTFVIPMTAGTVLQPPMPLPLLPKPEPGEALRALFLAAGDEERAININRMILPAAVQSSEYLPQDGRWSIQSPDGLLYGAFSALFLQRPDSGQTLHFLCDEVAWPSELKGFVSEYPVVDLPAPDPEFTTPGQVRYSLGESEAGLLAALAVNDRVILGDRSRSRTYSLQVAGLDVPQKKVILSYAATVFPPGQPAGRGLLDGLHATLIRPSTDAALQGAGSLLNMVATPDRLPPHMGDNNSRYARYRLPVLKDRKGNVWAYRGPHLSSDPGASIQAHWFYRTQPTFYFPSLGANQPAVGSLAPYLRPRRADGTYIGPEIVDQSTVEITSFPVTYRIQWPDLVPELRPGQTLTKPAFGLPAIRGNTSIDLLYEQSRAAEVHQYKSVTLIDPTAPKFYELAETGRLPRIPNSIRTTQSRGRTYFPELPPHLVERFYFDPNRGPRGALVFRGEFHDAPVGEDYLLLNTARGDDVLALKGLVSPSDELKTAWEESVGFLSAKLDTYVEDEAQRGTYKIDTTAERVLTQLLEIHSGETAVDSYALCANAPGRGYVSLIMGNGRAFTPVEEPVSVHIIKVGGPLHRGEVKPIAAANPLAEKLTMMHTADLAAATDEFEYDWRIAAPVDGTPPPVYEKQRQELATSGWEELPTLLPGESRTSLPNSDSGRWKVYAPGVPLTVVEKVAVVDADYQSLPGQELEIALAAEHRFNVGDSVRLEGFVPGAYNGTYVVSGVDVLTLRLPAETFPGVVQTLGTVSEVASGAGPQSIVRGNFTLAEGEEWDDVHISLDPHPALSYRLWVNGALVAARGWPGEPDTATVPPPYRFSPLPVLYRVDSSVIRPGTHQLMLELRSGADAGADLAFNLKVEANRWLDHPNLGGSQWQSREDIAADLRRIILGESADVQALSDNYLIVRYRAIDPDHSTRFDENGNPVAGWSKWTEPALAEGWIKRVLAGINPFNQRIRDLFANRVDTTASILSQAGARWEGDVALSLDSINDFGLIEIYETVLNRGRMLSIDNGINYGPANDALLLATGYLNDLYMMLGNEAWADAANPTIGIGSKDGTYGSVATALFAFKGQLPNLMEEELALLRGRDDFLQPGTRTPPVYNRLFWNYTRGIDSGEVIYALNYNILEDNDQGVDGVIDADDARKMYPQGHGDAYGHYLTAVKGYYRLLMDRDFTWVPRTEAVNILGKPVQVDYMDERKFAAAGAAVARVGKQVVDLTWRKDYVPRDASGDGLNWDTTFAPNRGNPATGLTRYWGVDHWASRTAQGSFIHWVVGNAMLPEVDPDPTHEGIQKIDRTTVPELLEFPTLVQSLQGSMDNAENGLNPLGLPEDTVPMDIASPTVTTIEYYIDGSTHFEQVYKRALVALQNAASAFDDAKDVTQIMRGEQDSLADFQTEVANQELAYKHSLIELYGTPYPDDTGPGKTYSADYDGPDFFHYMYVDTVRKDLEDATHSPASNYRYTQRIDLQQYPSDWYGDDKTDFDWVEQGLYPSDADANDDRETTAYLEYHLDGHGFLSKPTTWTGRRASPGELQKSISDIILAHNEAYETLKQHDALKYQLDRMIDVFEAKVSTHDEIRATEESLLAAREVLAWTKFATEQAIFYGELTFDINGWGIKAAKDALPKTVIVGTATGGHTTSAIEATMTVQEGTANIVRKGIVQGIKALAQAFEIGVNTAEAVTRFHDIAPKEWDQELRESVYELDMQLGNVQASLYTIYGKLQNLNAAYEAYRTAVAKGDRIQAEREVFRRRAAAIIQGYRTRDAAFRIFRNEKLERYKTLQDTATRYAYLTAKAYDYETGLLGTADGKRFLSRITAARALGVIQDGKPLFAGSNTGDPGLSSILAEMKADFDVLFGRLGMNNPQLMGTTASLRAENWRILPTEEGDTAWHDVLLAGRTRDILADADVRRFCLGLDSGRAAPVPGIILEFATQIQPGYNLFGKRLAAGDHAFEAGYFATKIVGAGVALEGYVGMDGSDASGNLVGVGGGQSPVGSLTQYLDPKGLSANPYVFLVPVGLDLMRSPPLGGTSQVRTWNVQDVAIPLPFNIGGSAFSSKPFWTSAESLSEPLFAIRKHPAFRPVPSGDSFSTEWPGIQEYVISPRLVGRSVWNSKWKLVIPGDRLLNDPEEGLNRFLATVKDIKIHFKTYSYAGN